MSYFKWLISAIIKTFTDDNYDVLKFIAIIFVFGFPFLFIGYLFNNTPFKTIGVIGFILGIFFALTYDYYRDNIKGKNK